MLSDNQKRLLQHIKEDQTIHSFEYLPKYARFLREHKLEEFAERQLELFRTRQLPLMNYLEKIGEEQLLKSWMYNNYIMLDHLAENRVYECIEYSVLNWIDNSKTSITRYQVTSEDIILINHFRRTIFRHFLPAYSSDFAVCSAITDEVEKFMVTLAITCLKVQADLQHQMYTQTQSIAKVGSWMLTLQPEQLYWSDELYRIYELDPHAERITRERARRFTMPGEQERIDKWVEASIRNSQPHDFYYRVRLENGEEKILHSRGEAKKDLDGKVVELWGTVQDVTKQQNAEFELHEKETLIKKITDISPTIIYVYHVRTGRFLFLNPSVRLLLGYEVKEVMESGVSFFFDRIHPDEREEITDNLVKAWSSDTTKSHREHGEPYYTYRILHNNGSYRTFNAYTSVFSRNKKEGVEYVLHVLVDSTHEHRLRRQLEEEKMLASMITEISLSRIIGLDRDHRVIIWNKAAEDFYGKTKKQVIGKRFEKVFELPAASMLLDNFDQAMGGTPVILKESHMPGEGWGEFHFMPLKNEQGLVFGVVAMIHDISRIKEINNELHELNEAFAHAEAIAEIGHWQWNATQKKWYFSDNQYRLLGCEPQSFQPGMEDFLHFVHEEDRSMVRKYAAEENLFIPEDTVVFRVIRADGQLRYFQASGKGMVNEYGEKLVIGIHMDITDLYELNLRLSQQNRELAERNSELESFNFIASHDLQEPLRKIQSFSGRIMQKHWNGISDEGKEYFQRISGAASRMQQLIDDLISFSQLSDTAMELQHISLEQLVVESIANLKTEDEEVEIDMQDLPEIKVVPFQFRQVVQNILSNAIKYRKPGQPARITIRSQRVPRQDMVLQNAPGISPAPWFHKISISDEGIGFEQQYAKKIFDLFQRLHTRHEYAGTGIGLAICKKVVNNHGGYIKANATPGVGATFDIYIPE